MSKEYQLAIKTVRHSNFADEYEGRAGLTKVPYKMLLQQSEIRNGELQSEIDELKDLVESLKARIAELEAENEPLKRGLLREVSKETKKEEMYNNIKGLMAHAREENVRLRKLNGQLMAKIYQLEQIQKGEENECQS